MMSSMRTTLTLDADVARLLADEVHRQRRPFKQVLNDAVRRGLTPRLADADVPVYRIVPHRGKLRPGFDPTAFNRLVDELEDEAIVAKLHPRRR
jgi:antitoxin (DNA-binding transcriptional repressor) of toxin-antitoxin stability system